MARNKIFLDTSIIITALLSTRGGSFHILTNFPNRYRFLINEYVLTETRDLLQRKFSHRPDLANDLFLLIGLANIEILPSPPLSRIKPLYKVIEPADAPILASALTNCNYLLSLDQDFLNNDIKSFARSQKLTIYSPREFIHNFQ